jgi:hypothetical protein
MFCRATWAAGPAHSVSALSHVVCAASAVRDASGVRRQWLLAGGGLGNNRPQPGAELDVNGDAVVPVSEAPGQSRIWARPRGRCRSKVWAPARARPEEALVPSRRARERRPSYGLPAGRSRPACTRASPGLAGRDWRHHHRSGTTLRRSWRKCARKQCCTGQAPFSAGLSASLFPKVPAWFHHGGLCV